ncbi:hypothetical protein TsFJ059_008494 [Trichoderma semiorbis]|uniref:Uncharacterized protein n=1 Tax=Trichoderma semiorbis TaxID=1491008 RepID=A0A9P8KP61_9HYPO|nr:hypothetical protein TsFJ059_008494 [Trichoderma semiorbis]
MHESLLGEANRERLSALQSEIKQKNETSLQDVSSKLLDAVATEAARDAGLELFDRLNVLLVTQASIQEDQRALSAPNEEILHVRGLAGPVAEKLIKLPVGSTDNTGQVVDYTARSLTAEVGMALLVLISLLCSSSEPFILDDTALVYVVTYTDKDDAWATVESSRLAARLVEISLADDKLDTFITQCLLHDTLRPLFSKSSTRLTASGRPLQISQPPNGMQPMTSLDNISQEQEKLQAASSFKWAVISCSKTAVGRHWPLFLPILLSLAEDHNTAVRLKGLRILGHFLDKCPSNTILSAGVDNVIQEAVFPTLLFLPSTTPENESIELLYPAYRVLLQVAQLDPDAKSLRRRRFLDKLLRDGIFVGHYHASQHARIIEVLMNMTKDIISCLGIFTAKHLQNLLQLFSTTLSDPFALAYPPLACATTEALNETLVNCWPRISSPGHTDQVLHMISLCWLNLKSSQLPKEGIDQISTHLIHTSTILQSLWNREGSAPPAQLTAVLQKEPRLVELIPNILK